MDLVSGDLSGLSQTLECCLHSSPSPRTNNLATNDKWTTGSDKVMWEYHNIAITRVPGYGFGIAVSGGRDNPHFSNGDPSIAISDVLKGGPAEGRLLVNDRVVSVNGMSLENVDYTRAVQVLRDSGSPVHLIVKRRVVLPNTNQDVHTLRITLTKNKKKDDFGIVLGCHLYVKEITNKSVSGKDGSGVNEGDIITKINNAPTDMMTLKEAKKLIENCKEKLQLVIRRESQSNDSQHYSLHDKASNPIKSDISNPAGFSDVGEVRNYSNQNLYVRPPMTGDKYRTPPPPPDMTDEKNNLVRMSGRSRGPIMDISLSQLDQLATPLLHNHGHSVSRLQAMGNEEEEPPPRPSPPVLEESGNMQRGFGDEDPLSRRRNHPLPDPRFISFLKEGSVGVRLTGGNKTGIFVTAVQPGSPASLQGLQPGDRILKVNNLDMKDITREEAVLYLLNLKDRIDLIAQYRKDEYDSVVASQTGDSFYIRTHFNYNNEHKGELSFRIGDIFHVVDTLYNGVVGSWQVYRIGRNNQETQKGVIPNKSRAEELSAECQNSAKKESLAESRGSFFKRRSARRTKLLMDSASKFPSYERTSLRHPRFTRPVILFGPLADVARDKLLNDCPSKFASPQLDNHLDDTPKTQKTCTTVRLSAIKDTSDRGKHAVIDITPNMVDRLNYAQFYPIVIFMRADNKHVIKELRTRLVKGNGKSSKKLFDHMLKLEKTWSHIFTATVNLTSADTWYKKVNEIIEIQQQQTIWMAEAKPEEMITDDFLFPITSRLSYASSPESDLDVANDITQKVTTENNLSFFGDRRLVKASSDPSIATQEDIGLPSYHGPPPYNEFDNSPYPKPHTGLPKSIETNNNDDRYFFHNNPNERSGTQHHVPSQHQKHDSYVNTMSNEIYSEKTNGNFTNPYYMTSRSPPKIPPKIDRGNKPHHLRSAKERLFGSNKLSVNNDGRHGNTGMSNYVDPNKTLPPEKTDVKQMNYQPSYESPSYGSDMYSRFRPNLNEEPKSNHHYNQYAGSQASRPAHDPYRFTRSTVQTNKTSMAEIKNKTPELKSRNDYKPVPPPKPKNYRSPNSVNNVEQPYWNNEEQHNIPNLRGPGPDSSPPKRSLDPMSRLSTTWESDYGTRSYASPQYRQNYSSYDSTSHTNSDHYAFDRVSSLKNRCDTDSIGFDSGQGSSLDRNYDCHSYVNKPVSVSSNSSRSYYYNVPPPKDPSYSNRDQNGLDLSNRENRGSAFELYKKPETRSPHGFSPLTVNTNSLKCESSSESSDEEDEEENPAEDEEENPAEKNRNGETMVMATIQGTFDEKGGVLHSPNTGISIVIPPDALVGEEEIFFKVCHDINMLPPLNEEKGEMLLSPLVMCGPQGLKFNKPVELKLPHCKPMNADKCYFTLKSNTTPIDPKAEWFNISMDTLDKEKQIEVHEDSVSLFISQF